MATGYGLPGFLREQLSIIFTDAIGPYWQPPPYSLDTRPNSNSVWDALARLMEKEFETFPRQDGRTTPFDRCRTYLATSSDLPGVLSLIGAFTVGRPW